jgi:hypothetical protein
VRLGLGEAEPEFVRLGLGDEAGDLGEERVPVDDWAVDGNIREGK